MSARQQDKGFSLIEVVVALGILSTAAISLSTLARGSLLGAQQLETRYLARVVADNQLAATFMEPEPLQIGIIEGEAQQLGRTFSWVRSVVATPEQGLLLVEVQVSETGSDNVLLKASTLKELGS